jgi:hypothetical protein
MLRIPTLALRLLLATVIAALVAPATATGEASVTRSAFQIPISITLEDVCLAEPVRVTATISVESQEVRDETGGVHFRNSTEWVDASAIGLFSGETYFLAVRRSLRVSSEGGPSNENEFTLVVIMQLVSPGGGENLTAVLTRHVTINADGELIIDLTHQEVRCTGGS